MDAASLAVALIGVVVGLVILVLCRRIHTEVKTLRGQLTIGTLASESESRRVGQIPRGDRTTQEQRHLDVAVLEDAPHEEE